MNIKTKRLNIRPFSKTEDLNNHYVDWLNDSEIIKYSDQRFITHSLTSCEKYIDWMHDNGHILLSIHDQKHNAHIGNIGLQFEHKHKRIDVSILMGEKNMQGTGRASEAWLAVLEEIESKKLTRKITAGTMEANTRMLNLMKKSGMEPDGVRKQHQYWQGQWVDIIYYAKFV